ncbi:hypothetical protein, partial [Lacticaseibacillus paracasei]|uniref:hypothetical protein n=1 Tax=Lacticaseibacillus paracasei TaxID=1597 RepID=UPI00388F9409
GKIKSARKTGVSPCLLCTNYNLYYSLTPIKLAVMLLSPATMYNNWRKRLLVGDSNDKSRKYRRGI